MLTATGIFNTIMFLVRLLIYTLIFIFFDDISNVLSSLFKSKRIASKLKKFAIDHDFPLLSNIIIQVREDKFIKIEHILFGNKYIYINYWYNKLIIKSSPPPNSRARSGTVSLAIVHRQADKHCSLTRELKVPPIHFVAEGHLTTQRPRKH